LTTHRVVGDSDPLHDRIGDVPLPSRGRVPARAAADPARRRLRGICAGDDRLLRLPARCACAARAYPRIRGTDGVARNTTRARGTARGLVTETVPTSTRRSTVLAIGDIVALLVFTLIGLANHRDGITASSVLKVMGPLVVVGGVAAAILGTYRRPGIRTLIPAWL